MQHRFTVFLAAMALALPCAAQADVLSARLELHGGGAGGVGVGGERKDDAFQSDARGGAYGGLVGVEILFVDVWVQHRQYHDGSLLGTWTQFMTGLDIDIDLGKAPDTTGANGKKVKSKAKGFAEIGIGAGFGVGTPRQVDPPLDNSEISDKGFLLEGRVAAGWYLAGGLSLGFAVPVTAGYYFMSDPGMNANDLGTHYQAVEAAFLVDLRLRLKIK